MGVSNRNLFVVSGGPGSGKTTVLHELASLGFAFAPEVARQIIREQAVGRNGGAVARSGGLHSSHAAAIN